MNLKTSVASLVMLFCLGFSLSAAAEVPETMTYKGNLTDGSGAPVDTTVEASFRLYDAANGGSEVWSETFSTIDVVNGSFSAQLGQTESLVDVFDGSAYWLEVSIDGETLSPRNPVESVPYALRSNRANEADSLQGLSAADVQAALSELASLRSRVESLESNLQGTGGTPIDVASLESRIGQNEASIATNTAAISTNTTAISANTSEILTNTANISSNATAIAVNEGDIATNAADVSSNAIMLYTHRTEIAALERVTQDMNRTIVNGQPAVTFTGVNVHVRNGLGSTDGDTGSGAQVNGLGNLIVGYDESRAFGRNKSGSHNLVVGSEHNYESYGGLVAGFRNTVSGSYAAISGGSASRASGEYSSISGGYNNDASGYHATVSGGNQNTASGWYSSVSGGYQNTASGYHATVSGGRERSVAGSYYWRAGTLIESQ
ncbi:hypothetical protein DV096_14225 [Bradymonadaceae bacterium TMQ3]|nr:hypothetical protein DV096_14225 [Bradymonadaceae bacterium TMQ3]TXC75209.1 hypothetical protein FRC91_14095 [Bradymonadales bacterium TMQ1]